MIKKVCERKGNVIFHLFTRFQIVDLRSIGVDSARVHVFLNRLMLGR